MRTILHVDCDAFYASVEALHRPELRNKPLAVGGDPEQRHGIILAKNQLAKKYGIQTGDALWQARKKCKDLVIVPPDFKLYMRFSRLCRDIYLRYTDQVEPFGLDESWLDVTGSKVYGSGEQIAQEIQQTVWRELGITVSVGVSFNKIFAKLGSDYKKPCGITVIDQDNFREKVWPLPVSDLLMVGRATSRKLNEHRIYTIGDLATTPVENLHRWFGKVGDMLWVFANGQDLTRVSQCDESQAIKSIGNSTTTPRDLYNNEDVKIIFQLLAESISRRLRDHGLKGRVISIQVRDCALQSFIRQHKINRYTSLAADIAREAMTIFAANYKWEMPIRSIGLSVGDLAPDTVPEQLDFLGDTIKRAKMETLEVTVDGLKRRFGTFAVQRGLMLSDKALSRCNPYDDHNIHPVSFLR